MRTECVVPPESQTGLIETYLAAMALLQSPLISDVTRAALTRLMQTLIEDIKSAARPESREKTLAQTAGEEVA